METILDLESVKEMSSREIKSALTARGLKADRTAKARLLRAVAAELPYRYAHEGLPEYEVNSIILGANIYNEKDIEPQVTENLGEEHSVRSLQSNRPNSEIHEEVSEGYGIDLDEMVKDIEESDDLKKKLISVANFFDPSQAPISKAAKLMKASIHVKTVGEYKKGDLVIISTIIHTEIVTSEGLSQEVLDVYTIQNIDRQNNISLSYLNSIRRRREEPRVFSFKIVSPVRMLTLCGDLEFRLRSAPAEEGGPEKEGTKKDGRNSTPDLLLGTTLYFIDKTNVENKVNQSRMSRRLTSPLLADRIKRNNVLETDVKLIWETLTNNATIQTDTPNVIATQDEISQGLSEWSTIRFLPAAKSHHALEILLKPEWGGKNGDDYWKLSLQHFSAESLNGKECFIEKQRLIVATRNFESFMVFCFGVAYRGITEELQISLHRGKLHDPVFLSDYVRYEVERAIRGVFVFLNSVTIQQTEEMKCVYDITVPTGVSAYIRHELSSITPRDSIATWFEKIKASEINYKEPGSSEVSIRERLKPESQPTKRLKTSQPHNQPMTKLGAADDPDIVCRYDLLGQLGVASKDGKIFSCKNGVKCKYRHESVRGMRPEQKRRIVSLNVSPKELADRAMSAIKD